MIALATPDATPLKPRSSLYAKARRAYSYPCKSLALHEITKGVVKLWLDVVELEVPIRIASHLISISHLRLIIIHLT